MSQLPPFYSNVAVLDRNLHRAKRLSAPERFFAFAARGNLIPAVMGEFPQACRDMPILFTDDGKEITPLFVVGLSRETNVFVDAEGKWRGTHIPAYLRRFPFIGGDTSDAKQVICVEQSFVGFQDELGERLFTEEGEPTPFLQRSIAFVSEYAEAAKATATFTKDLKALDLFRTVNVDVKGRDGTSASFHGFASIDEQKFIALSDNAFAKLRAKGYLSAIYAHLISLANFARLGDMSA